MEKPVKLRFLSPYVRSSGVQRKALYQELFSKNQQVKLSADHYIACPEDWFAKVVEKLYSEPVLVAC